MRVSGFTKKGNKDSGCKGTTACCPEGKDVSVYFSWLLSRSLLTALIVLPPSLKIYITMYERLPWGMGFGKIKII